MSKIDQFLDDYRDDGREDSSGAFTIDFQKAREKLAKFQLRDPHEFILKFVQAGNLASGASSQIDIDFRKVATIHFHDWNHEWTLERLAERLASASLVAEQDPLTHLAVGISALMGLEMEELQLTQKRQGEPNGRALLVKKTLEWDSVEQLNPEASFLRITLPIPKGISIATLRALLASRCGFSAVPIRLDGEALKAQLPETSGAHRAQFFRENEVLASQYRLPQDLPNLPAIRALAGRSSALECDRWAHLSLTVDLDPKATVWFCKDGVMTEVKKLDLGVPGIVGVVSADDVATDLTGSQFLEGKEFEQLKDTLTRASRGLLDNAIDATKNIVSQGQPPSASAPVKGWHGCSGCSFALLGWYLSLKALGHFGASWVTGWVMPLTFFWIGFPLVWVGYAVWRHGCEKDDKSDGNARQHLLETLYEAKKR